VRLSSVLVRSLVLHPRVRRGLHLVGILGLLLTAASCRPSSGAHAPKAGSGDRSAANAAVPVETFDVARGPISAFLSFNSTLETEAAVDIHPQANGQVTTLHVEEGDAVQQGDPLLQIDDRELRVELSDATISAQHLESSFARIQGLSSRGLLNQQDFDDKKYQLDQARLRVERARLALDHTTVRAPFDGVITAREVQTGARVSAGTKLFSIVKLDDITARVFVPGRYLAAVAENQPVVVTSEFLPGRTFDGWVKRISPVIDPKSGTFKVTVGVRGEVGQLAPGLFVHVQIITATRDSALLIPKGAVVYEGGDRYVFAVVENRAVKRKLDLGFEGIEHLEALSGFEPGTPIVVRGQNGLKDGATVRSVNRPPPDSPPAPPAGTPVASLPASGT
jgi:membrane fusion protein, multidrug efflux system